MQIMKNKQQFNFLYFPYISSKPYYLAISRANLNALDGDSRPFF